MKQKNYNYPYLEGEIKRKGIKKKKRNGSNDGLERIHILV